MTQAEMNTLEEILYQETSCIDPDDVPLLMEVIIANIPVKEEC